MGLLLLKADDFILHALVIRFRAFLVIKSFPIALLVLLANGVGAHKHLCYEYFNRGVYGVRGCFLALISLFFQFVVTSPVITHHMITNDRWYLKPGRMPGTLSLESLNVKSPIILIRFALFPHFKHFGLDMRVY